MEAELRERYQTEFVKIGSTADRDEVTDGPHESFLDLETIKDMAFGFFRSAQAPQWKGAPITGFRIMNETGEIVFRWTWWDELELKKQESERAYQERRKLDREGE